MGFLKRFFSLGSTKTRKNKKKQQQNASAAKVDAEGRIVAERQDPDTSANRLLRSSSTKFSVMSEIDYTTLPPLPHSVQDLLHPSPNFSPSASLITVASTTPIQRSGTYVVKVHGRTTHSRTEFPRANPPISPTKPRRKQPSTSASSSHDDFSDNEDDDARESEPQPRLKEVNFTPKDTSRMYQLRRDPSVASLLDLYDDKGCLDSAIFENTTLSPAPASAPRQGREPSKRSGSTLRQLLGGLEPPSNPNKTEGDISWAERFLNEQLGDDSSSSSPSTPELETPKDTSFPDAPSAPRVAAADTTLSSLDQDSSMYNPAISSMEVEVSGSEEGVFATVATPVAKPLLSDPKTPQRASEVFGFLTRRNTLPAKERDLPPLPQMTTPEHTGDTPHDTSLGDHLDATHSANTSHSTQLTSSDTNSHASHAQIHTATMTKLSSAFAASTTSLNLLITADEDSAEPTPTSQGVVSHSTGSALSLATSHTTGASLSSSNSTKAAPSKIPRGPRARPLSICRRDNAATQEVKSSEEPTLAYSPPAETVVVNQRRRTSDEKPRPVVREAFSNIRQPRQHRRIGSRSSAFSDDDSCDQSADPLKLAGPSSTSSKPEVQPRKRSTRPEQVLQWQGRGKENTPSPPPAGRASPGPSSIPLLSLTLATPARHRALMEPPSPASSSELSPVGREIMNDLRQQRMRARQVERRRGVWARE